MKLFTSILTTCFSIVMLSGFSFGQGIINKSGTTNQSSYTRNISNNGLATNMITSKEGSFIHVKNGTSPVTGILRANNSVRVTNQSKSTGKSLLRFTACFSDKLSSPDYAVVYFDPNATREFNGQLDALKMMNSDPNVPNIYTITPNGTKISIKAIPYDIDTTYNIRLGLKINRAGDVIFKIRDIVGTFSEMRISLFDNVTNTEQDLLNNQEYIIALCVGEYNDRFFLKLSNNLTYVPDNIPEPDFFSLYYSHSILKVKINDLQGTNGSLMIYNLFGQTLFTHEFYKEGYQEFSIYLKDGIYIAVYYSGKTKTVKKIFVKNY